MLNVYFENIKSILVQELTGASKSLKIAVAWLNDPVLFEIIFQKANVISVELLIVNDRLNNTSGNDFNSFIQTTPGKLYLAEASRLMHHKFAIIDDKHIITGSYNWTRGARNNHENIIIVDAPDVVNKYCLEFYSLTDTYGPEVTDYDKSKNIVIDAVQTEFSTELSLDEMMQHNLLPFDIGVKTHTDSFAITLHKNERLPIKRRLFTYNTVDNNQSGFKFEIRKRQSIQTAILDIGAFNLDFSQPCLNPNMPKADMYFSVTSIGELLIESYEIDGGRKTSFSYDLINNV